LEVFTDNLRRFRSGVPEFTEYRDHLGPGLSEREAMELVPELRKVIRQKARRLASDTALTTRNIRASAELRQSIANTRLQRFTLSLTIIAVTIAVISLLKA
jgi:hypothetical protein